MHNSSPTPALMLRRSPRDQPGHQAPPHRHGIIDNHHPRGCGGEQGERAEHSEADDVEQRRRDDMQPGHATWNGGAAALQPDQRKQGQRTDREPQAAKRPHTHLGQCDRHDRPAQAPDKSQEHEQQLGLGDFIQSVRRGHQPPLRDKLEARWRVRMRARCGTLVQSRPTNLLARAGDLHKHKHTRSKTGRWLPHRALLIPSDARSKLRCGGEWMASVPIPKFASLRGTRVCELRN